MAPFIHKRNENRQQQATLDLKLIWCCLVFSRIFNTGLQTILLINVMMKKCLIMFTLFLITLVLAALTERRHKLVINDNIAIGEKLSEDIAFEQTRKDQNVETKD